MVAVVERSTINMFGHLSNRHDEKYALYSINDNQDESLQSSIQSTIEIDNYENKH